MTVFYSDISLDPLYIHYCSEFKKRSKNSPVIFIDLKYYKEGKEVVEPRVMWRGSISSKEEPGYFAPLPSSYGRYEFRFAGIEKI